jgi:flagellar hook-associated protein 2
MSPMRISGLASGMDIDQMVKDLMKAEKMPLDKLKQNKQVLEWQRDDYRSMNTLLLDFRSTLIQMKMTTNYRSRMTTSSDESKVTATASSAASPSSYSVESVSVLASAARKNNVGVLTKVSQPKVDASKSISSQETSFANGMVWNLPVSGSVESQSITVIDPPTPIKLTLSNGIKLIDIPKTSVKVNGKAYEVITGTAPVDPTSLTDNQVFVSDSGELTFKTAPVKNDTIKVEFVANEKIETKTSSTPLTEMQLSKGSLDGTIFTLHYKDKDYILTSAANTDGTVNIVNGPTILGTLDKETGKIKFVPIAVEANEEVRVEYTQKYADFSITTRNATGNDVKESFLIQGSESLNSVINKVNASSAGVTMFYDSFSDRMSITRNETGNFKPGDEITLAGDFINTTLDFNNVTESGGTDSSFTINGLVTTRHANTFDLNGVTLTLKKTFSDAPATLNVTNDSTKVFDNIVKFVDTYNNLIDTVNKKVSEERYRDFTPLTDDQRETLSDKQQEQWEEKAKSGLLKRDSTLSSLLTTMRNNFSNPINQEGVASAYNQLASIGISTTRNYLEGGKLNIDEAKLKAALQADPTSVENLFRGDGPTSTQKGVVQRLYDSVNDSMDKLKAKAGNSYSTNQQFSIGLQLTSYDTRITAFTSKLTSKENRYYSQFTAMEKAIQKANQQSAYLTNNMGGGQ